MLRQKLITSLFATLITVIAAVSFDYLVNTYLLHTPGAFTPLTTTIISALVGLPVTLFLISQRDDIRRAACEIQRHREEAEAARDTAQAAMGKLTDSEARYRMLAERTTDIIVRFDPKGVIEFASPSIRQLGYEAADLVGHNMSEFAHPDEVAENERLRHEDAQVRGLRAHERRSRRADGTWIWLQGSPAPIHDEDGKWIGTVSVLRDVTARREMEDELRRKQAESEAATQVKSEFLANMTHELRTPLNAIVGFSGLLKASDALSPRDARQIGLIWDASHTLLRVVNDVLDFSKLEAGSIEPDVHPFDPEQLARSTVDLLSGQALVKQLKVSVAVTGLEGPLLCDGARLRQVMLNFLSNAIKFTTIGEIVVRLRQTSEGEQRRLRIEVRDSGMGVPADQIDTIFDRFTQGDASISRQFGGTGLGLAISKRIVEALGGEIGVQSTPGGGSTFWFEITAPPASADEAAASEAAEEVTAGAEPAGLDVRLRLLVVDDNAVNRELVCTLLEPFDLDIETACDGAEAVEAAHRRAFDLILMDVQMPTMDGLTATRRIRASATAGARHTPIIAMTANVLPAQIQRCFEAGMDDHLGKPISPRKLLEALQRWAPGDQEPAEATASVA
jgi:PAS domain S-box-containing protein